MSRLQETWHTFAFKSFREREKRKEELWMATSSLILKVKGASFML